MAIGGRKTRAAMNTFDLNTAHDLRAKMRRDLERMRANPMDSDAAFNFFVTAEHMPDWIYPKREKKQERETLKNSEIILRICSHLANGAKHFEVEAKHHDTVQSSGRRRGWHGSWAGGPWFGPWFGGSCLVIHLKGDAEQALGPAISAIDLATKIMEFWENYSST